MISYRDLAPAHTVIDYVHVDDHKHNDLTAGFVRDWWFSCAPVPHTKKVWFAQLNVISLRHYMGDTEVATNTRKAKKPAENVSGDWRGFVNVNLTEDEWVTIDRVMADKKNPPEIAPSIDYLLELGKVTFNYTNGSVSCALTIQEGVSKGLTVSSFSDNCIEALLVTRLKVQNYLPQFEDIFAGGVKQTRRRG